MLQTTRLHSTMLESTSPALQELFYTHAVLSFEKQLRLEELAGECDWSVDLDTGRLAFDDRYDFPAQLLGTESVESETWLWAWGNPSVTSSQVVTAARRLKVYGERHGVPEFARAQIPLEEVNGHTLGLVVAGLQGADAYYLGHYEGGAALLLIEGAELRGAEACSAPGIAQLFTRFASAFPCRHRDALLGYLRGKGCSLEETENGIRARTPAGESLEARFDALGRLSGLTAGG